MQFRDFLKDKWLQIWLLVLGIISIEIFLMIYPIGYFVKIYVALSLVVLYGIGVLVEYFNKKRFYQDFTNTLKELKEKYLITEIIKTPDFLEGKIFQSWLEEINKSMLEHVNYYKYLRRRL